MNTRRRDAVRLTYLPTGESVTVSRQPEHKNEAKWRRWANQFARHLLASKLCRPKTEPMVRTYTLWPYQSIRQGPSIGNQTTILEGEPHVLRVLDGALAPLRPKA